MSAGLVLGIDCSTTGVIAVVVDMAGVKLAEGRSPLAASNPRPGWYEQDALSWWQAVASAIRAALDRLGHARVGDLAGLSVANQRESFVLVDRGLRPLGPAI